MFEITDRVSCPRPVADFLRDYALAHDHDPDEFGLSGFLDVVWPEGLPGTVYAANIGRDPLAPLHRIDILVRPVCEGPMADLPQVGGLTLGLQVFRGHGRLNIKRIEVTPHVPRRDFEVCLSAPMFWRPDDRYMDGGDFDAIAGLPYHRAHTKERLTEWREYLDWKEAKIRKDQLSIPYRAWRWESETVLAFLVHESDIPERRISGTELGAAPLPPDEDEEDEDLLELDFPRRRRRRDPDVRKLGEVEGVHPLDSRRTKDIEGWGQSYLPRGARRLRVRLDEDDAEELAKRPIPREGLLMSSIWGDLAPIHNQRSGVQRLNNSQSFSPRLADFIFSSRSASVPAGDVAELPPVPGGRELNPGQREAVAKALAAPDLCLIQGPPGTGKTTVIADICLRAVLAGQRVLIASQTNLAVDNALARLADVPAVRALRIGDPGRVDDEFRDFLVDNVIDHWFASIGDQCRKRRRGGDRLAREIEAAAARVDKLRAALVASEEADARVAAARDAEGKALETAERQRARVEDARTLRDDAVSKGDRLAGLVAWANREAALPMEAASISLPDGLMLPEGVDGSLPPLAALDRVMDERERRRELLAALDGATVSTAPNPEAAEELKALRQEKRGLIDSDEDEDLLRLRKVNRRIKELEKGGWNSATGAVNRAARSLWDGRPPECVATVIDALKPDDATLEALDEARALVRRELELADEVGVLVREAASVWTDERRAADAKTNEASSALRNQEDRLEAAQERAEAATAEVGEAEAAVEAAGRAWEEAWTPAVEDEDEECPRPSAEALARAQEELEASRDEAADRLKRAERWKSIQGEWVERLGKISESDREQLQAMYVRRANVVGMTCNEAGKRKTWQDPEFKPFDIVIIDEVSKATPPELILPMLLGRKTILVGDHRQLPPMFRERDASFGEATANGEITESDYERFRRMVTASLFQELFEEAPDAIRATLWMQYRMHPHVMDAVNQFYEDRLVPGPSRDELVDARRHHIDIPDAGGGKLLRPGQHLLWVDSSSDEDGRVVREEQRGSSKANELEVRLIVSFLLRLGRSLRAHGYGGVFEEELAGRHQGKTWRQVVRGLLPGAPEATLDDLFAERRVRVEGRAQPPDGPARPGARLVIRAQKEVGVLTFYGAQLKDLRGEIDAWRHKHPKAFAALELRTNTVDRFQGMEKPIIVASLVRSKRGKLGQFVREYQRINVGLSRAQQVLVVVGAEDTWKHAEVPLPPIEGGDPVDVPAYRNILELARRVGGRRVARQVLVA